VIPPPILDTWRRSALLENLQGDVRRSAEELADSCHHAAWSDEGNALIWEQFHTPETRAAGMPWLLFRSREARRSAPASGCRRHQILLPDRNRRVIGVEMAYRCFAVSQPGMRRCTLFKGDVQARIAPGGTGEPAVEPGNATLTCIRLEERTPWPVDQGALVAK
jgi:hypothetical protein